MYGASLIVLKDALWEYQKYRYIFAQWIVVQLDGMSSNFTRVRFLGISHVTADYQEIVVTLVVLLFQEYIFRSFHI